jgi:putative copper export protein/methionine-rich copper-binding protein CopC
MGRRLAAIVVMAFGLVLTASPKADAHALLAGSDPAAGAQLERAPAAIRLTFTEAPDVSLSVVHVLNRDGESEEKGRPAGVAGQRNSVTVAVPDLGKGSYTVAWRTTSAVDGHTTGGAFSFGVQVPAVAVAVATAPHTPKPSPIGVAGRVGYYAGLLVLVGAATVAVPRTRRWRLLAWVVAATGFVALTVDALRTTDVGISTLASTTTGTKLLIELAAIVVVGAAVLLSNRVIIVAGAAALGLLARAWAGHAAASTAPWFTVGVQWVHMVAVGVWIGGLPWLLMTMRDRDALRRFSRVATYALLVVVTTGVLRSLSEVRSWEGLLHTGFGQTLLVKLAVVVLVIALGTFNRFRGRVVSVGTEALVGLSVLAITAVLAGLAPAAAVVANRPPVVTVDGSDFATTMLARVEVSPGTAGPNHFEATISDYDTHERVAARAVTLRLAPADRPDVAAATVPLNRTRDKWVTDSTAMAIAGRWRMVVVVETSRGGTEIPLEISTRQPAQRIKAERSPGLPTFYTITIGNRRVETYVDPGKRGDNEVHFTYYDSAGNEAQTELAEITMRGRALVTRRLGPGHFVADAKLGKGTWRFDARTADGLRVHFSETIR